MVGSFRVQGGHAFALPGDRWSARDARTRARAFGPLLVPLNPYWGQVADRAEVVALYSATNGGACRCSPENRDSVVGGSWCGARLAETSEFLAG